MYARCERQSNPAILSDDVYEAGSAGVFSAFVWPVMAGRGRCRNSLIFVLDQGRYGSKQVRQLSKLRNPIQGIRTLVVRLTWLAWGALCRAIDQSGRDMLGDRRQIRWLRIAQP